MELEAAREDTGEFLQSRLREISSQTESTELIENLSWKMSAHTSRVRELVQVPRLGDPEVSQQVAVGLAVDQPLEASFFHSILDGLAGRLSLMPPGVTDPPTSSRASISRQWAATLREAVKATEGRDIELEQVAHTVAPPGLHLDYDLDFQTRRVDDIAPTLTSPLLSGLVDNIRQLEKPRIPKKSASFKADEGLWGLSWALPKPNVLGLSCDEGMPSKKPANEGEILEDEPRGQEESLQDQPLFKPNPEEVAEIVISEGDESA